MLRFAKTISKGLALNLIATLPAWLFPSSGWLAAFPALIIIDLSMTLVHIWWHGPLARLHATRAHHLVPESSVDYTVGAVWGPWEPLIGTAVVWGNIVLLNISIGPALFATTVMQLAALWAHTNWWPRWYRHLEWVMITPRSHRVHHSPNPGLYGRNCAFLFNWDRLLGTWTAPV